MHQKNRSGRCGAAGRLLLAAVVFGVLAMAQADTERSASYVAGLERQHTDVTKLVRTGDQGTLQKQLGRWRASKKDKDREKYDIATKLLVCSRGLPNLQALIDGDLLLLNAAVDGAISCLKPDASIAFFDVLVKRPCLAPDCFASPEGTVLKARVGTRVSYDSLLSSAIDREQPELVRLLLAKAGKPRVRLEKAIKYGNSTSDFSVAEALITAGADPNRQETIKDYAPNVSITINGRSMPQEGDITYPEGPTPLYQAIEMGNPKGVEFLLKHGADKMLKFRVKEGTRQGYTGLGMGLDSMTSRPRYVLMTPGEFACKQNKTEICEMLK